MTLKRYRQAKIAITMIVAAVFSQAVIRNSYIIPVAVLAASILALLYMRRTVTEIVADERDYANGGKAALRAIQIHSLASVAVAMALFAMRGSDPAYELAASVLAYSACILMLVYSFLFKRYSDGPAMNKKLVALAFVAAALIAVAGARLLTAEDSWVCKDGQWTKHGNPSSPAPAAACK